MSKRRRFAVIGTTILLLMGGGVAYAAWTQGGTGVASAQATTVTALVVTPGSPAGLLYPKPTGGYPSTAIGAVYTTVANPNSYPVQVTAVTIGTAMITPLTGQTCAPGSVVASTTGAMTLTSPITIPAGSTGTAVTVPGAIEMISTATDGCQGAAFSVPVTLTGAAA